MNDAAPPTLFQQALGAAFFNLPETLRRLHGVRGTARYAGIASIERGRGLLARAFAPRYGHAPGIVVFASGVSNSSETDEAAFLREQDLLQRSLADATRLADLGSARDNAARRLEQAEQAWLELLEDT